MRTDPVDAALRAGIRLLESFERTVHWQFTVAFLAVPLLAGGLAAWLTGWGVDTPETLYVVVAGILPVLALGALVEAGFAAAREVSDTQRTMELIRKHQAGELPGKLTVEPEDELRLALWTGRVLVNVIFGYLAIGEAVCLIAIGSATSSAFLLVTALATLAMQIYFLGLLHMERYDEVRRELELEKLRADLVEARDAGD